MSIPDYQTIMLPLLQFSADEEEHSFREAIDALSNEFTLSEEERKELLPGGQQEIFSNRVGWARTYLKKAGLLDSPKRGYLRITQRGIDVLNENPQKIDAEFLDRFDGFREFRKLKREKTTQNDAVENEQEMTPGEALENAYQSLVTI